MFHERIFLADYLENTITNGLCKSIITKINREKLTKISNLFWIFSTEWIKILKKCHHVCRKLSKIFIENLSSSLFSFLFTIFWMLIEIVHANKKDENRPKQQSLALVFLLVRITQAHPEFFFHKVFMSYHVYKLFFATYLSLYWAQIACRGEIRGDIQFTGTFDRNFNTSNFNRNVFVWRHENRIYLPIDETLHHRSSSHRLKSNWMNSVTSHKISSYNNIVSIARMSSKNSPKAWILLHKRKNHHQFDEIKKKKVM